MHATDGAVAAPIRRDGGRRARARHFNGAARRAAAVALLMAICVIAQWRRLLAQLRRLLAQ